MYVLRGHPAHVVAPQLCTAWLIGSRPITLQRMPCCTSSRPIVVAMLPRRSVGSVVAVRRSGSVGARPHRFLAVASGN